MMIAEAGQINLALKKERVKMKQLAVICGPNLNLLGTREPGLYGAKTIADIEHDLREYIGNRAELTFRQSNHEGELVDWVQRAGLDRIPVILNAGAYTHTSIALRDAISGAKTTVIEIHLTNVHRREEFRQLSYLSAVCKGTISGLGDISFRLAADALL